METYREFKRKAIAKNEEKTEKVKQKTKKNKVEISESDRWAGFFDLFNNEFLEVVILPRITKHLLDKDFISFACSEKNIACYYLRRS